ncbi:hypothetical protein D3C84_1076910 [compost metagenome]
MNFFTLMKSKWKLVNQFLVIFVEKVKSPFPAMFLSIKILAIKIDVNNEVTIPISNVKAKPLIGPVPKINKIAPVKTCVTFASMIERIAPCHP